METFALLGKNLFEKCRTSQATSEDLSKRLSHLRRWYQGQFDSDYDFVFAHQADDRQYIKSILAPIDLDIEYIFKYAKCY